MDTKEIVTKYYESLAMKNDNWKEMYTLDAISSDAARILLANGKNAVINSFAPFLKGVNEVKKKSSL